MISLTNILTQRNFESRAFFQIVYEWEDILSHELSIPVRNDLHRKSILCRAFCRAFPVVERCYKPHTPTFAFEMATMQDPGNNNKNIIPCIIDFFINDHRELKRFYKNYKLNPIVLISSKEAFEFLRANKCPLPIKHWALSIPDHYVDPCAVEAARPYDIAIMGRSNPILDQFREKYIASHPHINCLQRIRRSGQYFYYSIKDGKEYPANTRNEYFQVMQMSKVGLYATPGIDGSKVEANGFNQVTPRFLELIASGCHVLARYPKNPDTEFYELDRFSPNIETYELFEQQMDWALMNPVDKLLYTSYIRKHTTSVRATQLLEILKDA